MKILFLTPRDSRKHIGGVETHVRVLTKELVKRGHAVKELSLDTRKGSDLHPQGRAFGDKSQAWRYLWQKRDVFKWADVVHIHDVFWWYFPFALMSYLGKLLWRVPQHYVSLLPWATSTRRKSASAGYGRADRFLESKNLGPSVFTTFHGWEGECPPSGSAIIQKRIAKKLSRGTIGIGTFFQKWYGVEPDKVSWGALDDQWINRPIDKWTNRQMKKFKITFYGRLDAVNGIDVAQEAFEILKGPAFRTKGRALRSEFLFIGDGPVREQAEKIGKVTGMVEDPRKFLMQSDLVITSSYLCMLETAAMMKPMIAIATNPLKSDYLTSNPLAMYVTICHSSREIVDSVLSFRLVKQRENIQKARVWATRQTTKKLADTYLELWSK